MSDDGDPNIRLEDDDDYLLDDLSDDGEMIEEVKMMEHNRRFQAAVLRTMEKQLDDMENSLAEKDNELLMNERAREDLGLAFRGVKRDLDRISKSLDVSNRERRGAIHARKLAESIAANTAKENKTLQSRCKDLAEEVSNLKQQLSKAREEVHEGKELHNIFTSDLKMHRQLKANMEQELNRLKSSIDTSTAEKEQERKRFELQNQEIQQLKKALDAQEGETKKSMNALENVAKELEIVKTSRDVLMRQWENALEAMTKRDEALRLVDEKRQEAAERANSLKTSERILEQENQSLLKQHANMELKEKSRQDELFVLRTANMNIQRENTGLQKKVENLLKSLHQLQADYNSITKDKDRLYKENQRIRDQYVRQENEMKEFRNKNIGVKETAEATVKDMEKQTEEREKKMTLEMKEAKRRAIHLDNERQAEKYKAMELERMVKDTTTKNIMLDNEFKTLLKKYHDVHNEVHTLEDELERMTYKANKMESEAHALRTEQEKSKNAELSRIMGTIKALEKQLESKQAEYGALNVAFVQTQEKVLAAHKEHQEATDTTSRLRTQLLLAEAERNRFQAQLNKLEEDYAERCKEVTTVQLDMRKLNQALIKQKESTETLSKKLEDASFLFKLKKQEQEREVELLRTELARIKSEKSSGVEFITISAKRLEATKLKLEKLQFRYDHQKGRLDDALRKIMGLKQQMKHQKKDLSVDERNYREWSAQFEQIFAKEMKQRRHGRTLANRSVKGRVAGQGGVSGANTARARMPLSEVTRRAALLAEQKAKAAVSRLPTGGARVTPAGREMMRERGKAIFDTIAPIPSPRGRGGGGGGGGSKRTKDPQFVDKLVVELKQQLHKTSSQSAERMNELVRLRLKTKNALTMRDDIKNRYRILYDKYTNMSGETSAMKKDLLKLESQLSRAKCMAAHMESQLQDLSQQHLILAQQYIKDPALLPMPNINYTFNPDVEPSARLNASFVADIHEAEVFALSALEINLARQKINARTDNVLDAGLPYTPVELVKAAVDKDLKEQEEQQDNVNINNTKNKINDNTAKIRNSDNSYGLPIPDDPKRGSKLKPDGVAISQVKHEDLPIGRVRRPMIRTTVSGLIVKKDRGLMAMARTTPDPLSGSPSSTSSPSSSSYRGQGHNLSKTGRTGNQQYAKHGRRSKGGHGSKGSSSASSHYSNNRFASSSSSSSKYRGATLDSIGDIQRFMKTIDDF